MLNANLQLLPLFDPTIYVRVLQAKESDVKARLSHSFSVEIGASDSDESMTSLILDEDLGFCMISTRTDGYPTCTADVESCRDSWCTIGSALRSPLTIEAGEVAIPSEFSREQLRAGLPSRSVLEDVMDSGWLGAGTPGRATVLYEDFPAAAMVFKGLRKAARKHLFTPWSDRRRNMTAITQASGVTGSGEAFKIGGGGAGPIMLLAEPKYFDEYIAPASHRGES